MRRSDINKLTKKANALFIKHGWTLPEWATWSTEDFAKHPDLASYLRQHQMGWDVTDFGCDLFKKRGLVLFCFRNGIAGRVDEKPYAEKLMMVMEGQETPLHYHQAKMEDIINRAGGVLVLEFYAIDEAGKPTKEKVAIRVDGTLCILSPGESLKLRSGQSVTVPQRTLHRFFAEPGKGTVIAGEVSQCNDDHADNYFLDDLGRFSAIEEDEQIKSPLWNEVGLG
jgi:D-lyxose ketol-isomerase